MATIIVSGIDGLILMYLLEEVISEVLGYIHLVKKDLDSRYSKVAVAHANDYLCIACHKDEESYIELSICADTQRRNHTTEVPLNLSDTTLQARVFSYKYNQRNIAAWKIGFVKCKNTQIYHIPVPYNESIWDYNGFIKLFNSHFIY